MEKLGHPVLPAAVGEQHVCAPPPLTMSVLPPLTVFRCLPQILALQ